MDKLEKKLAKINNLTNIGMLVNDFFNKAMTL